VTTRMRPRSNGISNATAGSASADSCHSVLDRRPPCWTRIAVTAVASCSAA
jgi:hypothetical protein